MDKVKVFSLYQLCSDITYTGYDLHETGRPISTGCLYSREGK